MNNVWPKYPGPRKSHRLIMTCLAATFSSSPPEICFNFYSRSEAVENLNKLLLHKWETHTQSCWNFWRSFAPSPTRRDRAKTSRRQKEKNVSRQITQRLFIFGCAILLANSQVWLAINSRLSRARTAKVRANFRPNDRISARLTDVGDWFWHSI